MNLRLGGEWNATYSARVRKAGEFRVDRPEFLRLPLLLANDLQEGGEAR